MGAGRLVLCFICCALVGCSGSRPARELSRETLSQLVEYEDQVRDMSRVLQTHYRRTIADMQTDIAAAGRSSNRTSDAILAQDAVDELLARRLVDRSLRNFLEAVVARNAADRAQFADLLARLIAAETEAIRATTLEEKALQVTRARLEQLQREPSLSDRAEQIRPILETVSVALSLQGEPNASPSTGGGQ